MKQAGSNKLRRAICIALIFVMSLIFMYAGHFLFEEKRNAGNELDQNASGETLTTEGSESNESTSVPVVNPVKYSHRSEMVNGVKQEIHILEVDLENPGVRVQPVLSHDLIYGFEYLSVMAERKNAYAAVTGGFFHDFGLPSGMVVIGGELISTATGRYPVFLAENGKAALREIESKLTIYYGPEKGKGNSEIENSGENGNDGSSSSGDGAGSGLLPVDKFNSPSGNKEVAVYTPVYGKYNRADKKNITVTVEAGVVTKIADYTGEAEIPQNGMLISFFDTARYAGVELPIKLGDSVQLSHRPPIGEHTDAYECGSWLVRDGESVVPLRDAWVGVLTNRDPRTAIGIREDGTVLLLVVDGRQPGYSAGFTGQELAEYLISCGVKDAAMLDGGASAEMLVGGKLVSRPSHKGEERPVGGGVLILLDQETSTPD